MIIASDSPDDLNDEIVRQTQNFNQGIHLLFTQAGRTRSGDQRGHEHFGFKDGVSQPGILGVDQPDDPKENPDQGHPGQDLIQPGEFVLGYRKQPGAPGSNHDVPDAGPSWIKDGSYLVFRRLRQNVKGFRDFITTQAKAEGIDPSVMGARLVGRYESGAPLERTKDEPANFDPTVKDPSLAYPGLLDDAHNNPRLPWTKGQTNHRRTGPRHCTERRHTHLQPTRRKTGSHNAHAAMGNHHGR